MSMKDLVPKFRRREERLPISRREEDSLFSFQHEMNRLFDDFFDGFGLGPVLDWDEHSLARSEFSPRVDVSETKTEVKLSAELPGMDEKDIAVELGESQVSIRGEKKEEHEDKGTDWYRKEQSYGAFNRTIPLPSNVDGDNAKAKFKSGKLTITIPKLKEEPTNRKVIDIETD